MKRMISLFLILTMAVSLSACGDDSKVKKEQPKDTGVVSTSKVDKANLSTENQTENQKTASRTTTVTVKNNGENTKKTITTTNITTSKTSTTTKAANVYKYKNAWGTSYQMETDCKEYVASLNLPSDHAGYAYSSCFKNIYEYDNSYADRWGYDEIKCGYTYSAPEEFKRGVFSVIKTYFDPNGNYYKEMYNTITIMFVTKDNLYNTPWISSDNIKKLETYIRNDDDIVAIFVYGQV